MFLFYYCSKRKPWLSEVAGLAVIGFLNTMALRVDAGVAYTQAPHHTTPHGSTQALCMGRVGSRSPRLRLSCNSWPRGLQSTDQNVACLVRKIAALPHVCTTQYSTSLQLGCATGMVQQTGMRCRWGGGSSHDARCTMHCTTLRYDPPRHRQT